MASAYDPGITAERIRAASYARLEALGFRPARWLPLERDDLRGVRSPEELAHRLLALNAVFTWAAYDEVAVSSERIERYMERNQLLEWMTPQEQAVVALARDGAQEQFGESIGWRLENMWPLAWTLGFELEPGVQGQMITDDVIHAMIFNFLPGLDSDVATLLAKTKVRFSDEVLALEDLFYCAHNAARGAWLGQDTAPADFHPVLNGGVIHERRHALTWACSPQVAWDDTDLST